VGFEQDNSILRDHIGVGVGIPSGTVTFLFTDIEGSTRLWEAAPEAMQTVLARHDEIIRKAADSYSGVVFATGGDGFAVAFHRAGDALGAAIQAQRNLAAEPWPGPAIRVRMGLHTGEAAERDGDYFGPAVNRAARLMAVAHGGQVVCSEATAGLVSGETALANLGEHRLRDLSAPQRVFQVLAAGLPERFPPLESLDSYPGNLPLAPTRFVGRERTVRDVAEALEQTRLVTITGVGGVGKTRLALQVAAESLADFPDGVWLVELGGLGDPGSVEVAVASALGVQARPDQPVATTLLGFLRGRQLLLVVDNCEHLVGAVAGVVERVIGSCPRVRVLATSREGLAIAGERVLPLGPMEVASEESIDALVSSEAVRLLADRAADVRPGFTVTAQNAALVGRLCRRLDGIPLALELAAARLRSMSPADVLDHLDQRFRLLTGGRRTALSRQYTLRGAIDWSFELLDPIERAVLRRLGVFAGGFDLPAAEQVAGWGEVEAYDVADLVDRLVDKSLVVADPSGDTARYRLLEMLRDYAWERLIEVGETEATSFRHAEHFLGFAEAADAGLRGPDEEQWIQRVQQELDNLRGTVAWAVNNGHTDLALRIIAAIATGFGSRIGAPFGPWAERAAAMPGAASHPLRCVALASAATAEADRGSDRCRALAEEAFTEASRLPVDQHSARARCRAFSGIGIVISRQGDQHHLYETCEQRLVAANLLGDPWEQAHALTVVAGLNAGTPTGADAGQEAIRLARALGNPSSVAFALMMAAPTLASADPERATAMLEEAIGIVTVADNSFAIMHAYGSLARAHTLRGDARAAARAHLTAARVASQCGDHPYLCISIAGAACRLAEAGESDTAALLGTWAALSAGWPDDWMTTGHFAMAHGETLALAQALNVLARPERNKLNRKAEAMGDDEVLALTVECVERLG
jgi:predicted ATPase/class 3 adenylate cyclase